MATACALACSAPAWSQAGAAASLPLSLSTRYDAVRVKVPGQPSEHLGLVSAALLGQAHDAWWLGPVVVGAATGQRGGLFVLGGQVEHRWQGPGPWQARLSLMAGGGGGAGAPVGGGLMWQPAATVLYDLGAVQAGLSLSQLAFAGGHVGGTQLGAVISWDGRRPYFDVGSVGRSLSLDARSGLGFDRIQLDTGVYRQRARGGEAATSMRLVGVRAEQRQGEHGFWGVEAAAATHGGADGYMELLGTAGWETSAAAWGLSPLSLGARVALGLGGGGAVPTGGGVLGKASALLRWDLTRDAYLGLEAGAARSGDGRYQARFSQVVAGWQLDHPGASPDGIGLFSPGKVVGMDVSASVQHLTHAARKDGSTAALDTVGIEVNRWLSERFYLTGQAHSAFAGRAGAYSVGLAGLGWSTRWDDAPWRLGAELLAGAAGGGGVATQGGAVGQAMLKLGYQPSPDRVWQLDLGRVRSQRGGLDSPVLGLSWVQRFGVGQR